MDRGEQSSAAYRVLVVEDDKLNRIVIGQMLRQADLVGEAAGSAREALELLRMRTFDLVLMDIEMPEMNGLEATRAIRSGEAGEANRDVPVVAMTAYAEAEDEQRCYEAGMTGYLSKPLRIGTFLRTVQSALQD